MELQNIVSDSRQRGIDGYLGYSNALLFNLLLLVQLPQLVHCDVRVWISPLEEHCALRHGLAGPSLERKIKRQELHLLLCELVLRDYFVVQDRLFAKLQLSTDTVHVRIGLI